MLVAMARLRVWFSMPVVVVLGCGRPAEPAAPPTPNSGPIAQREPAAAIVVDAPGGSIARPGLASPPAPTIIDGGRIVDIKQASGQRQLAIAFDSRIDASQITTRWSAALVAGGKLVPRGELLIVTSSQHYVRVTLASDIERPEQYHVRFTHPE